MLSGRTARVVLFAALAIVAASGAQAQWKWRDAKGQIHVSDLPPPREVADRDVLQRPNARVPVAPAAAAPAASASAGAPAVATAASAAASAAKADTDLEKKRKAAEQEQAAKTKAEEEKLAAKRAENCKRARSQLGTLESGLRIARTNDKGEQEIIDDRARADEVRRAREVIASECR